MNTTREQVRAVVRQLCGRLPPKKEKNTNGTNGVSTLGFVRFHLVSIEYVTLMPVGFLQTEVGAGWWRMKMRASWRPQPSS